MYPRDLIIKYIPAISLLMKAKSKHVLNKCQTTKSISLNMDLFVVELFIAIKNVKVLKLHQKSEGLTHRS